MIPRKDELERYETTEARDIIRVFEAVRPPREVQAPPDFRVKVLAQIEQRRARHRFIAGLSPMWAPVWVPALAVGLLLSLSFNAWLGFRALKQLAPGDRQVADAGPGNLASEPLFDAYTFLARIQSATDLGTLVTTHSVIGKRATIFGFAGTSASARSFIIGTLYTDALAYLRGRDLEDAAQHLQALEKELIDSQGPHALVNYLGTMHNLLESQRYPAEVLGELLSLFEPFYTDYARSKGADMLTLFRAGIWLESMSLAAAAGDKEALRQVKAVQYFTKAMRRLNAPKGAMIALGQISHIIAKQALTDRDVKELHKLVKKMQMLLG